MNEIWLIHPHAILCHRDPEPFARATNVCFVWMPFHVLDPAMVFHSSDSNLTPCASDWFNDPSGMPTATHMSCCQQAFWIFLAQDVSSWIFVGFGCVCAWAWTATILGMHQFWLTETSWTDAWVVCSQQHRKARFEVFGTGTRQLLQSRHVHKS